MLTSVNIFWPASARPFSPVGRKKLSFLVHHRKSFEFRGVHCCRTELTKLGLHLFSKPCQHRRTASFPNDPLTSVYWADRGGASRWSAKGTESVDVTYIDDSGPNSKRADLWLFLCKRPTQRVHGCLRNKRVSFPRPKGPRQEHTLVELYAAHP